MYVQISPERTVQTCTSIGVAKACRNVHKFLARFRLQKWILSPVPPISSSLHHLRFELGTGGDMKLFYYVHPCQLSWIYHVVELSWRDPYIRGGSRGKFRGGVISLIFGSQVSIDHFFKRHEVYFTTLYYDKTNANFTCVAIFKCGSTSVCLWPWSGGNNASILAWVQVWSNFTCFFLFAFNVLTTTAVLIV